MHVWATDSGKKITVLDGNHLGAVQNVKFNPKYMMLASTCTNMVSEDVFICPVQQLFTGRFTIETPVNFLNYLKFLKVWF